MTDVEKLQSLIDEADSLIQRRVNSMSPEFTAWQVKTGRFLEKTYGLESYELTAFAATRFSPQILTSRNSFSRIYVTGFPAALDCTFIGRNNL